MSHLDRQHDDNGRPTLADRLHDYAELVRLPNVFTAIADAMLGYLVVRPFDADDSLLLALVLGASAMLYLAGIVLNDVFDYRLDLEQRPERPLPSGRIARRTAAWMGAILLLLGVAAGWGAAASVHALRPGIVATLLAALVLMYDGLLKRTPLGPLAMGGCRMLNVLLGMSVYPAAWHGAHWQVAAALGIYIVGVTWFARDEAGRSRRWQLVAALVVVMGGIGLLAALLRWPSEVPQIARDPSRWYLLLAVLAALIGWRCVWAIIDPRPMQVRNAVRQCLISVIYLDAVACFAFRGQIEAIAILILLLPTVLLGRYLAVT